MNEINAIREDGRQHFALMPNIVDEMGLSVYAYRLYGHLKRVTGEYGTCNQSTRTMAQTCAMSTASISRAKQELIAAGLIRVREMKGQHGGHDYHEITIVDVWAKNYEYYQARKQVTESNSQVTGSNLHVSPQKLASYCGAIKEESFKDLKESSSVQQPPEPSDPEIEFERMIEQKTGYGCKEGDRKTVSAWVRDGVKLEDLVAALRWMADNGRHAYGASQLDKSVRRAMADRIQADNKNLPAGAVRPAGGASQPSRRTGAIERMKARIANGEPI